MVSCEKVLFSLGEEFFSGLFVGEGKCVGKNRNRKKTEDSEVVLSCMVESVGLCDAEGVASDSAESVEDTFAERWVLR